jgi:PKD repeat protein
MWSIVLAAAGPPPPNQPPLAGFTSTCNGLTCTFSASPSTDSDGTVVDATWDFGGTAGGAGLQASHTFGTPGTYTVTVTVVDDDGATSSPVSRDVEVSLPAPSPISFVGVAASNGNLQSHRLTVPAGVQPGDALVLAFTANNNATVSGPTGVSGWQLLGVESNGSMSTRLWTRVATAGNAGAAVTVTTSTYSKGNMVLSAYRGTSPTSPVAAWDSTLENVSRTTHTTPSVPVTNGQSWVVWYWVHKDSATVQLTPPPGVTVRSNANQGGSSGKVTGLLADSNGPVGAGAATNLTATAASANSSATMWTIVLAPA